MIVRLARIIMDEPRESNPETTSVFDLFTLTTQTAMLSEYRELGSLFPAPQLS
ncbi:MAG: hypothetical protein OXH31_00655 [Gammaproteobacteria bacterium]|nr:hypothetical protein [Gammaproteobacteria bacterium]